MAYAVLPSVRSRTMRATTSSGVDLALLYVDRESLLRPGLSPGWLCVAVSPRAESTVTSGVPAADVPCAASLTRGTLAGVSRLL